MTKEKKVSSSLEKDWEIKDRVYFLISRKKPIIMTVPARHTEKRPLLWFDNDLGYERELRYATNQASPFVDEQEGPVTLEHIVFRDGTLFVPRNKQALQKLLSLYHPLRNGVYQEFDAVQEAVDELDVIELEIEALNAANNMEVDVAEAILRVELGSRVATMTSKEIKRDLLIYARRNPKTFLDLAKDENVQIRNFGIKAVENGIIKLDDDQRTFKWATNGRKLMTVPFDENPYSALAAFFKTDEGVEIYQNIEKRLK